MTEAEFLASYRPDAFDRPAVTVDLILLTIEAGAIHILLVQRNEYPHLGSWSLPGGFVGIDEDLDAAARRILREKTGLKGIAVEQLQTFGSVKRDPRMRVITVAHFALVPAAAFSPAVRRRTGVELARVTGTEVQDSDRRALQLAFDHAKIIEVAVNRLRGKLDYSDVAYRLLPGEFTLWQLQQVHEAILGRPVNKPAFRKRMIDSGRLQATGRREEGAKYRPAELYRYIGTSA